jgi:hypothetical protein
VRDEGQDEDPSKSSLLVQDQRVALGALSDSSNLKMILHLLDAKDTSLIDGNEFFPSMDYPRYCGVIGYDQAIS